MNIKLTKEQIYLIISVAISVVTLAIVFATKRRNQRPDLELKPEDGGVQTTNEGEIDTAIYKRKAESIYNSLSGWNMSSTGMEDTNEIVRPLTNNELRLLVNAYNELYGTDENYPTLRDLLFNEWLSCGEWYNFGYVSTACQQKNYILNRLNQIGA